MPVKPLYSLLKYYVPIAFRLYYRRFRIRNRHLVPKKGPIIFAVNHQNAFMDAMVVAVSSHYRPWFLTRASIFKKPVARFWLGALKMIPIYRIRDGLGQVKRNDSSIDKCRDLLLKGQSLLIFPEGDHNHKWMLRPLQKGLARIAFAALKANPACGLKVVPVGLQYENYRAFGSELLVSFGQPIAIDEYLPDYKISKTRAHEKLMADVKMELLKLMVAIQNENRYDEIKKGLAERYREPDLEIRLQHDKKFIAGDFSNSVKNSEEPRSRLLFRIPGFPFFLYALVNHILPILVIKWIMKRFVRDHHWESSIRFAGMILITPLFYLLQTGLVYLSTNQLLWTLVYFLSLPISAWIGARYWQELTILRF